MNRSLKPKSKITLSSGNVKTVFEINEVIGKGGSCVAYKVTYTGVDGSRHRGVLKEFFPVWLTTKDFVRNQEEITVSEENRDSFEKGLQEFRETYDFITDFLIDNEQAANYHSQPIRYYTGNNTGYVLSYYFNGKSYGDIKGESLSAVFEVILSTVKAVEMYHRNGYLHLDIKPKNILVPSETTQSIKLFDFDSLTKFERIKTGELHVLPAPEDYRVPDFDSLNWSGVDYRTDIFEIGAMLFMRLFGRAPQSNDICVGAKIRLDNNKYLKVASPLLRQRVTEILRKTIVVNIDRRYSDISELREAVEQVLRLIDSEAPYLINMPKWQPSANILGRKQEIKEIDERLEKDGYVFVRGIGGLGKSELAKLYARCYAEKYHTVQFIRFSGNLKTLVATMTTDGINEKDFDDFELLVSAKNALLHQSDKGTLIIVDNFNVRHDRFLRLFIPAGNNSFKVIFTTRCSPSAEYYRPYVYNVPHLSPEDCEKLFYMHLGCETQDAGTDGQLKKLIEYVNYNTLIIVLIAETLKNSTGLTISDMYNKIVNQEMDSINIPVFYEYDNSDVDVQEYSRMYNHLQSVFSIATLTEGQVEILKNATLIPPDGIQLDRFVRYCGSDAVNKADVRELVGLGWLNEDENSLITMHPVVSDLISLNGQIAAKESYYRFEQKQENFCRVGRCGFRTAMRKLACAKHLERRYINAPDKKKLSIAMKIGCLHDSLFQSEKAKTYLEKALEMAISQKSEEAMALACQHLGDYYREFGTNSEAIRYLERSIEIGRRPQNGFYKLVVESMVQIANCYRDNNDNVRAYSTYLRALIYARKHKILQYITDISDELIEVCNELGWDKRVGKYLEISDRFRVFDTDENDELFDENEFVFEGDESPDELLNKYYEYLQKNRDALGGESPLYKDLQKFLWLYKLQAGCSKEAEALLEERLAFIAQTSGEDSMDMAEEKALVALTFADIGDFDNVDDFAIDAIRICERLKDTHMYAYYRAHIALAKLSVMQGDTKRMNACLDKVDFSAYSGKTFLTETVKTVGVILLKAERYEEAERICRKAIKHKEINPKVRVCAELILSCLSEINNSTEESQRHIRNALSTVCAMERNTAKDCINQIKAMFSFSDVAIAVTLKDFFDTVERVCSEDTTHNKGAE